MTHRSRTYYKRKKIIRECYRAFALDIIAGSMRANIISKTPPLPLYTEGRENKKLYAEQIILHTKILRAEKTQAITDGVINIANSTLLRIEDMRQKLSKLYKSDHSDN